ncbi:efflux RND transporter periplasmic adaptor subunit [Rubellicoccus peritrichatus]|uniref:Efflux RND transporter periplasmic adaptor subunit n=1 Tax=Rubellicoccus peritrichatus TaxID=3080537 RepID=A0AAQ3L647_9BACT|nr:efflux RND transporter periplasmic adaptor subunit [Puniceicoccus sp. CR14]WOO39761.1 efflux RND transporter periplasmic adaptor subunit [Puniceicoccus sp. CR14]
MLTEKDKLTERTRTGGGKQIVIVILGLIGVVVAGILMWLPPKPREAAGFGGGPAPVIVETASTRTIDDLIEALGTVKANEHTALASKITERVNKVLFEDGQLVKKGDLLVQLDDTEVQALLAEAKAQLAEREAQIERIRSVEDSGALSRSVIDEEMSRYGIARARMDLIEAGVNDRRIVAPFDGQVGLREVSPGQLVTPADTIITISDLTPVKVDFTVPERYISKLKTGQLITATSVAFPDRIFEGEIRSISPNIDPISRAAQIRAFIPNKDHALLPGMLLNILVNLGSDEVLTINEAALIPLANKQYVMVVGADGMAEQIEVEMGRRFPGEVEILGGITPGTQIITQGFRARPGEAVDVKTEEDVFTSR